MPSPKNTNRRFKRSLLVAVSVVTLAACADKSEQGAGTGAPMVNHLGASVALGSNYGFMSLMFSLGDGKNFASFYADSAVMVRTGLEPIRGRANIDEFARRVELMKNRPKAFDRTSGGLRLEGREVTDSGTFVVPSEGPLPADLLPAKGRYWTRWRYTDAGSWIILVDSLFADGNK